MSQICGMLKNPAIYVEVGIAGQIDRPFLAQFNHSLTEISHVALRGAPLEMTGGTKGGAQRARTLKTLVWRGGSPVTATPIYHLPLEENTCDFKLIYFLIISYVTDKAVYCCWVSVYLLINYDILFVYYICILYLYILFLHLAVRQGFAEPRLGITVLQFRMNFGSCRWCDRVLELQRHLKSSALPL
jgi:hypothetical protein